MTKDPKVSAHLPTRFGDFRLHVFTGDDGAEHMALAAGEPANGCLVRVHSECATGDILGSLRCDCRDQLEASLKKIAAAGQGLFIYLRDHEGRGIGLANKIKAYVLQDEGMDTVDANIHLGFAPDARSYEAAIFILKHFGLNEVKLLTNNRRKVEALEKAGIKVAETIPLWTATNPHNEKYVETKRTKLGHI